MRRDCRYGEADPTQWPQLYIKDMCHLSAMPSRPRLPDDPMSILWADFAPVDFYNLIGGLLKGLGNPSPRFVKRYQPIHDQLISRLTMYKASPKPNQRTLVLARALEHAFGRFISLPMTFQQLQFTWTDVQRLHLEVCGAIDYMLDFHPRMTGVKEPATKLAQVMGAFTYEALIAQELMRAGIPVWFVQPFEKVLAANVASITDARRPADFLVLEDASPAFDDIFLGMPDDPKRYVEMSAYPRQTYLLPDPFASEPRQPAAIPSRDKIAPPPSHQNNSRTPQKVITEYEYLMKEHCPPCPDIWHYAALLHPRPSLRTPTQSPSEPNHAGYIFPDPALILRVQTNKKRAVYVYHWLSFRKDLLFRFTKPEYKMPLIPNQLWRDFLLNGTSNPEPTESFASARRLRVLSMLGDCIDSAGVSLSQDSSSSVDWNGYQITKDQLPDKSVVQKIVWELNELSFRLELMSLNNCLARRLETTSPNDLDHMACFPPCRAMLAFDEAAANLGLAAPQQAQRIQYMRALAQLMTKWDGCPEVVRRGAGSTNLGPSKTNQFEQQVVRFYVKSFTYQYGRLPILPLNLSL